MIWQCRIIGSWSEDRFVGTSPTTAQRALATLANSTYLPEGFQHPLILGQGVLITLQINFQGLLDNLCKHLQGGCPINKERGNLFAITLKKLKVKIKIQVATDSFKHYKRFIFWLGLLIYTTCSSSQSRETLQPVHRTVQLETRTWKSDHKHRWCKRLVNTQPRVHIHSQVYSPWV